MHVFTAEATSRTGEDQGLADISVYVDNDEGTVRVCLDVAGEDPQYTLYVPNHIDAITKLADALASIALLWDGKPRGFDGFGSNHCNQNDTGTANKERGSVLYREDGIVNWY